MWSRRLMPGRVARPVSLAVAGAAAFSALLTGCVPAGTGGTGPVVTLSPTQGPSPTPTASAAPTQPPTSAPPSSPTPTSSSTADGRRAVNLGGNYSNGVFSVGVIPVGGNIGAGPTGTFLIHEGSALIGQVNVAYDPTDGYYGGHFALTVAPGRHTFAYDYSGDATYQPAHSTGNIDVNNVQVTAQIPGGTVVWGQSFTVDVQVSPISGVAGTPTGAVRNRSDYGFTSNGATLDSQGRATLTVTPEPGLTPISAPRTGAIFIDYAGDDTFTPWTVLVQFTFVPAPAA